ncbi:hypothetical protein Tco_0540921, partial [Tanacetum coccineum]
FSLGRNLPPYWGCIPKQPDSPIAPCGATGFGYDGALTLSGTPFQGTWAWSVTEDASPDYNSDSEAARFLSWAVPGSLAVTKGILVRRNETLIYTIDTIVQRSRFSKTTCATCWLVHSWCYVEEECYLVDPASSHMLVSKIKPCMFKKLVVGLWVGSAGPPYGVHRFTRPFCRRCAPGLNWLGRASGAVTLKKLECSKQAYALRTTAKAFAKDVFINQERKLGARRRSDTVLVSTINDADQGSADVAYRTPLAPYEKSKFLGSGGSMVARLKLKGIDGRAPPGVEPAA